MYKRQAPSIAVALVGSNFAGLHGAALTSACLAYLGGGAIAVGGLGMAGGTAAIVGGGAVLGLGVVALPSCLPSSRENTACQGRAQPVIACRLQIDRMLRTIYYKRIIYLFVPHATVKEDKNDETVRIL